MIKKIFTFLILMFFIPFMVSAYEIKVDSENIFEHFLEEPFDFVSSDDGGFALSGYPRLDLRDYSVIKYDIDGNVSWRNITDGHYWLFGLRNNEFVALDNDMILKYDKDGNILWQKNWGGNGYDELLYAIETYDGGIIVWGESSSTDIEGLPNKGGKDDIFIKFDKDGNLLWQRSWDGSEGDRLFNIFALQDGGFIAIGLSTITDSVEAQIKGSVDALIVKYDKDGNIIWKKLWGGNDSEYFNYVQVDSNDNIIVTGTSSSSDIEGLPNRGEDDLIIVKYSKDGNVIWQKNWGGSDRDYDWKIQISENDELFIISHSYSTDIEGSSCDATEKEAIFLKYDKDGNIVWQSCWGGEWNDWFYDMLPMSDGGAIVVGRTESTDIEGLSNINGYAAIVLRYDKNGNIVWKDIWNPSGLDSFRSIQKIDNSTFVVRGYWLGEYKNIDRAYVGIVKKYLIEYSFNNIISKNGSYTTVQDGSNGIITTAPDKGFEVDKITVKDSLGNEVEVTSNSNGIYSFSLNDDVSVEVLFKEEVVNPKTGVIDIISTLFVGFVISFIGYTLVKKNCYQYDL